jgi:hypothetical protein
MQRLRPSTTLVLASVSSAAIALGTLAVGASLAFGAPASAAATPGTLFWSTTKAKGAILFENPQVIRGVETEVVAAACAGLPPAKRVKTQRRYRNFRCLLVYRPSDGGRQARATIYFRTRTARTWCWNDTSLEQLIASRACRL